MRYGFCKEFSTPMKTEVDYDLIKAIKEAGFDFVEMRAMLVSSLSDEEFSRLEAFLKEINLDCDCCCALFPKNIRTTGNDADRKVIYEYAEKTFDRCKRLGASTIVYGSAPSRALDEETTQDEGYAQISSMISEILVPLCEKYDITVVMEPLRADACNFINTLSDGMRVVNAVKSEKVKLLADTIHMMSNSDNAEDIINFSDNLSHIHISELQRVLPEDGYSDYVAKILSNLNTVGYNGTISFESKNGSGLESMKKALTLLKKQFN